MDGNFEAEAEWLFYLNDNGIKFLCLWKINLAALPKLLPIKINLLLFRLLRWHAASFGINGKVGF